MLDALQRQQVASMDDSEATRDRVHTKQVAAVANTAVVGARPSRLEPEWSEAGRQRARFERADEESEPQSAMGCHLGPLHPCHNAAIAASIDGTKWTDGGAGEAARARAAARRSGAPAAAESDEDVDPGL